MTYITHTTSVNSLTKGPNMDVLFFIFSLSFLAAGAYGYYKIFLWVAPKAMDLADKAYYWYRGKKNG